MLKKVSYRRIKNIDIDDFKHDLSSILDTHAPVETKDGPVSHGSMILSVLKNKLGGG